MSGDVPFSETTVDRLDSWLKLVEGECPVSYRVCVGRMGEEAIIEDTERRRVSLQQVGRDMCLEARRKRQQEQERMKHEIEAEEMQQQGSSVNRYNLNEADGPRYEDWESNFIASGALINGGDSDNQQHKECNLNASRCNFNFLLHKVRKPILNDLQRGQVRNYRQAYVELLRRSVYEQDLSAQSSSTDIASDDDNDYSDEQDDIVEQHKGLETNDIIHDLGDVALEDDEDTSIENVEECVNDNADNIYKFLIDFDNNDDVIKHDFAHESSNAGTSDDDDNPDYTNFPFEEDIISLSQMYSIVRRCFISSDVAVYEAYCRCSGIHVALKLKAGWDDDRAREYELLSAVQDCPYIVRVHAYHELWQRRTTCVVLHWVSSVPMLPQQIPLYMKQLLLAVAYLHSCNILHRDVKRTNALWTGSCLQLIDLDLGTYHQSTRLHQRHVGTPGYMSPEQLAVKLARDQGSISQLSGYSFQTDTYAIGAVLGQQLFKTPEYVLEQLPHLVQVWRTSAMQTPKHAVPHQQTRHLLELFVELTASDPRERIVISQALQHPIFRE